MADSGESGGSNSIVAGFKQVYDLPIPVHVAIVVVLGSVLFAPDPYADGLGFTAFLELSRPFVGVLFLTALTLGLARGFAAVVAYYQEERERRETLSRWQSRMDTLTADEKVVLRKFIHEGKRVAHFPFGDGVVNVLIGENVLGHAAQNGYPEAWPYHIQPWAWDYLNANPGVLEPDEREKVAQEAEQQRRGAFRW